MNPRAIVSGMMCANNCGEPAKIVDSHGEWFCSVGCAAIFNLNKLHKHFDNMRGGSKKI